MNFSRPILVAVSVAFMVGCDTPSEPVLDDLAIEDAALHRGRGHARRSVRLRGRGIYVIESVDADVHFRINARQRKDGEARGRFRKSLIFQEQLISFEGEVTCLAFDREQGRAWVGGIVTKNDSEHPGFTTEIHQPGKDVWFRVLDTGRRSDEADRSTFLGFEGGGGIITSAEYCELQIWPGPPDNPENARTNPVIDGRIRLR